MTNKGVELNAIGALQTPITCPFDGGWVLYLPLTDQMLVLNPSAKLVWEMLVRNCEDDEIASALAEHFGIPFERASSDVAQILASLKDIKSKSDAAAGYPISLSLSTEVTSACAANQLDFEYCGSFRFGERLIYVRSSVPEVNESFFSRFRHRAVGNGKDADVLEVSRRDTTYCLIFRGSLLAEVTTVNAMMWCVIELLLNLEHSNTALLAYCHSAAVSKGNHRLLMPGRSGVGKSTLTAFLVVNGFAYVGDDVIAIGEDDGALLPLPTCLSIKSGSWPILEQFYPGLGQLPTLNRYGRSMRHVEPQHNYEVLQATSAPSAIVFPAYKEGNQTHLSPLPPLQTMIHLLGAHAALATPATEDKLRKLIRFVEQTPAYELTYSELPSALKAIEDLLAAQPRE